MGGTLTKEEEDDSRSSSASTSNENTKTTKKAEQGSPETQLANRVKFTVSEKDSDREAEAEDENEDDSVRERERDLEPFDPDNYDPSNYGPILPNGEINWDCPCLGGAANGPCATEFRSAFSCFHHSKEDPKGADCFPSFENMHVCFSKYPDLYKSRGDEEDDGDDEDQVQFDADELKVINEESDEPAPPREESPQQKEKPNQKSKEKEEPKHKHSEPPSRKEPLLPQAGQPAVL